MSLWAPPLLHTSTFLEPNCGPDPEHSLVLLSWPVLLPTKGQHSSWSLLQPVLRTRVPSQSYLHGPIPSFSCTFWSLNCSLNKIIHLKILLSAYSLPSRILGFGCTDVNKVTCDFSKLRNKDCNLLEKPTATKQHIQAGNRTSWMARTWASRAKNVQVKHAARCKRVMKEHGCVLAKKSIQHVM